MIIGDHREQKFGLVPREAVRWAGPSTPARYVERDDPGCFFCFNRFCFILLQVTCAQLSNLPLG